MIIPCKRTPISEEHARAGLSAALSAAGVTSQQATTLLLAHWGHETARGEGMYNNNPGNIGASVAGDRFRFEDCGFPTPPGNPVYFAAYASLDIGCAAMVSLLRRLYPEAWAILIAPNPDAKEYVAALVNYRYNYFTAPLLSYQVAVASLYQEYSLPSTAIPSTIRYGSRGNVVKRWQLIVGTTPDSIFGPLTRQATITWQRKRGLTADGIVGPLTWALALI